MTSKQIAHFVQQICEGFIANGSGSYTWTDITEAMRRANLRGRVPNWMAVRDTMATVNAAHGWTRDHSDLNVERYVPRTSETTVTTLKVASAIRDGGQTLRTINRDPAADHSPAVRAEIFGMREQIARSAEAFPLPERFTAYPADDGPAMIVTDTTTMRYARVGLYAYGSVRETLSALFSEDL